MNIMNRFTLKTLKKNKVRTLVTIIGIILSTAMFTAVTSIVTSLQQYVVNLEIGQEGAWEGRILDQDSDRVEKFVKKKELTGYTVVSQLGYAALQGSYNESKPYLCVESIQDNFTEYSPIKIVEGHMAKRDDELVLPKHLEENGGISYKVGDSITIEMGKRINSEGTVLGQRDNYVVPSKGQKSEEKLADTHSKTYRIVGICERPSFESFSAPGYTAFTKSGDTGIKQDVLFCSEKPVNTAKIIRTFMKKYQDQIESGYDYLVHSELLRFRGQSPDENYMAVLTNLGIALVLIIMVASVSLIYNAFSISVSERTKQFGLLKSIGATKKQIRKSVYFEALYLCVLGIPLGAISGLVGIGITLHFVGKLMYNMMTGSAETSLELVVMPEAIVAAMVIAMVTVLISAMIPARRAVKMNAIEAMRETRDVRIRGKKIRSPKWVYRLFGFEGMLANKNFKRNRKKYRLTVFSLAISVVLFVTTTEFSNYMKGSLDVLEQECAMDISLLMTEENMGKHSLPETKKQLEQLKHVDKVSYCTTVNQALLYTDLENLDEEYVKNAKDSQILTVDEKSKKAIVPVSLCFVDDDSYREYLEENHFDVSRFMDSDKLCPLVWDVAQMMRQGKGGVAKCHILKGNTLAGELYGVNKIKGYEYAGNLSLDKGQMNFDFASEDIEDGEESQSKTFPAQKAVSKIEFNQSQVTNKPAPLGAGRVSVWSGYITAVLPESAREKISGKINFESYNNYYIQAKNHEGAVTAISDFLKNEGGYGKEAVSNIYDQRASEEASRALVLVVDIFSYGFIALITLIVIANVFNTISTNIQLRRKEFAMLKSVGMTRKGFDKMMNYECMLYGVKGLLFGLPVSFLFCYLMYLSLVEGWNVSFMIPWTSVGIVIVSVFAIVFVSMIYSMSKIKKDNPIEALRNDNL